jgi:hypothetical protein
LLIPYGVTNPHVDMSAFGMLKIILTRPDLTIGIKIKGKYQKDICP